MYHGTLFTKQGALGRIFPTLGTDILWRLACIRRLCRHCSRWILLLVPWEAGRCGSGSGAWVVIPLWFTPRLRVKPLSESCKIFLGLGILLITVVIIIRGLWT
jgi:hypothetical protein